jgi:cellobiose phosphorylase
MWEDMVEKMNKFFGLHIINDNLVFDPVLPPKTEGFNDERKLADLKAADL